MKNSAVRGVPFPTASISEAAELRLQFAQLANSLDHAADVVVKKAVDLATVFLGRIVDPQQNAYLSESHIETSAVLYER